MFRFFTCAKCTLLVATKKEDGDCNEEGGVLFRTLK